MDILTLLLRLPFLPVQGLVRLAEIIRDEADRQLYDPAAVQRELEEAADARAAGEISDEELARIEDQAVGRLTGQGPPSSAPDQGKRR